MKKLIDLTHTIEDKLPVYPGDDETRLYQTKHLEIDKYNNHRLEISIHSGTHIDSPMHLTKKNEYISQIPLEKFIGEGCVLEVRNEFIVYMKEEYRDKVKENNIVLLCTGYDKKFGSDEYFDNSPIIDKNFAEFLIEKNIKILGLDSPSPDKYPFEIHKMLFDKDILIIENLKNLDQLLSINKFEVIAFPLNIKADGSILRVVAREL